jgi:hypothetical protein
MIDSEASITQRAGMARTVEFPVPSFEKLEAAKELIGAEICS